MNFNMGQKGGGSESTKGYKKLYERPMNLTIRQGNQKCDSVRHKRKTLIEKYKYCGTGQPQRQYPVNGKMCSGCGETNHFKTVYRSAQRQWKGQRLPKSGRSVHKVQQMRSSIC